MTDPAAPVPHPIDAVALTAAHSGAYLSAVFAAYRAGQVVLALPQGSAVRNLPGVTIVDRQAFEDGPGWFAEPFTPIVSDAPAQIAFSSGTTGRPKAFLLSHRTLSDVVTRINTAMQVDETIREYVGVPVTFSFGFARIRAVAAAGGQSFLPAHGFDPSEIARMLRAGEINAVSAVPTLWRVLLANADLVRDVGGQLRWIEIGSQYMAAAEKAALKALFPNARIVQHYGLTEASRATLLDISATDGPALESVGKPTSACEIALTEDGRIRVRGPHVAMGLVTGPGLKPVTDADGWLTTSDRGRIEDGYLYYAGRTDELINCGGVKIDPVQFEQRLGAALGDPGAVAVGRIDDALRGEKVLIARRDASGVSQTAVESAATEIAAGYGLTGGGNLTYRRVADFPTTATGKIQRGQLADLPDLDAAPAPPDTDPASAAPASGKAAELQALWAEILGQPEVSLYESFYDLGGDSLSALTVMLRMEALGIEAETARGIFAGKTIAEMMDLPPEGSAPAAAPVPDPSTTPAAPIPAKAAELQALWAEILGQPEVSLYESFYDLGGDSLSALTVMLRMEALGIEAETARGIFAGKTIAEIVGAPPEGAPPARVPASPAAASPAPVPPAAQTAAPATGPVLRLAEAVNAVHATRGVLVWWVVVVHWLPGLLLRISRDAIWIYEALVPLLRFGTPGFAMVFGLGIGALGIPQYRRNPTSFLRSARTNAMLIGAGFLLMALFRFGELVTAGPLDYDILPSKLFYSVITYYVLIMLCLPVLMRLICLGPNRVLTILALATGSMIIHEILVATIASAQPGGVLELFKIILTAKYGFFRMTAIALIGVLMGHFFRTHHDAPGLVRDMTLAGLTIFAAGLLITYEAQDGALLEGFGRVKIWHIIVYAGMTLTLLAGFSWLNRAGRAAQSRTWHRLNVFAIASGILALPIFVGHAIVLPAKDFLINLGTPDLIAIAATLAVFLFGLAVAYRRLFRYLL